jgi:hypothetical protein
MSTVYIRPCVRCVRLAVWGHGQVSGLGEISGGLLTPVFAFLLALSVGVLVAVIKEAGLAGSLAAFGTGAVTYLEVRRLRGARVSDTRPEVVAIPLGHRGAD